MKGRDLVNWLTLHKDYTIPAACFLIGTLLGTLLGALAF